MKNYQESVGIDVSKTTIDVSCYLCKKHKVFKNDINGYHSMLNGEKSKQGVFLFFYT